MGKIYKCDKCGKTAESPNFPLKWATIDLKYGNEKTKATFDFCSYCTKDIFKSNELKQKIDNVFKSIKNGIEKQKSNSKRKKKK